MSSRTEQGRLRFQLLGYAENVVALARIGPAAVEIRKKTAQSLYNGKDTALFAEAHGEGHPAIRLHPAGPFRPHALTTRALHLRYPYKNGGKRIIVGVTTVDAR